MKTLNELYTDMSDDDFNVLRGVLKEMRTRGMQFEERLVDTEDPYIWVSPPLETIVMPIRVYSIAGVIAWRTQNEVDGPPNGPAHAFDVMKDAARIIERAVENAEDTGKEDVPTMDAAVQMAISNAVNAISDWASRHAWRRTTQFTKTEGTGMTVNSIADMVRECLYSVNVGENTVTGRTADRRTVTTNLAEDGGLVISCEDRMTAVHPWDVTSYSVRSAVMSVVQG